VRLIASWTNEPQRVKATRRLALSHEPDCTDIEQLAVAFQPDAIAVGLVLLGVRFEEDGVEVLKDIHAVHVIKL
jgi:hypothetical protein